MFPTQRTSDWVMSSVGDDTLIYDRATNELHTLKAHHVAVWDACTGRNSTSEIARLVHLDAGTVEQCLAQLSAAGLLESPRAIVSRRKLLGTAGVVTGIVSISAPSALAAVSCPPGTTPCPGGCLAGGLDTPINCGACGNVCGGANACNRPVCNGGICGTVPINEGSVCNRYGTCHSGICVET